MVEETKNKVVCKRCLMNSEVIGFEESIDGCNFCDYFFLQKKLYLKSKDDLDIIVENTIERGKNKYDAILGLSGGFDSSSVCYWCKKEGLNVLLVHVDNGFNKVVGDNNIQALVNWTGYDIVYPKVNQEAFTEMYMSMIKSGVINLEHLSDNLINSYVLKVAQEKKIDLFITGSNVNTEALRVLGFGSPNTDKKNLIGIAKAFGTRKELRQLKLLGPLKIGVLRFKKRMLFPLNYLDYNPFSMADTLCKEISGFAKYGEKHEESILTDWYQNYWLPKKYGIDKRLVVYSNNVCAGHMTRKEGFRKLNIPLIEKEYQMKIMASKFGFKNMDVFEEVLENIQPVPYQRYGVDKLRRFISAYYFGIRRRLRGF